jgi:hypothetical protein
MPAEKNLNEEADERVGLRESLATHEFSSIDQENQRQGLFFLVLATGNLPYLSGLSKAKLAT